MNITNRFKMLPNKRNFILNLINNNYSDKTVDNYKRDLFIFELFLWYKNISFDNIDKQLVIEYKGFLKNGKHHDLIDEFEKIVFETLIEAEIELVPREIRKSLSKPSKKRPNSKDGLSAVSINRMLSSLRSYLTFLIDIDVSVSLPPRAIKMVRTIKKESQVADFNEIVKLIEFPEKFETNKIIKYRNRAILELLFSTGMRISELVSLNRDQVSISKASNTLDSNSVDINSKIYILGKGKKQRFVYLTERCAYFVKRYLEIRNDDFPALFIPYRGLRRHSDNLNMVRISTNYVQSIMKKYRLLLNIAIPTTPHSLRHAFATYLAEQGASPAAIQKLLGHESLQTTTRYVHSSDKFAAKTHKKYHPLKKR